MIYIAHRINTISELSKVSQHYGIEVDIRDSKEGLYLSHDPFSEGEDFESFLKHYRQKFIILNIKSERIEHRVLELIKKYKIKNYFFLDCSFPMVYTLASMGEMNIAARYSDFEPLENILAIKHMIKWIWVDCFSNFPVNKDSYEIIKETGLKTCLVSPELQGRNDDVIKYRDFIAENRMEFDAICTKINQIDTWHEKIL